MLKALSHPNLLKYHDRLPDKERGGLCFIFKHMAVGTLADHRKRPENILQSNDGTIKVDVIGCISQDFTVLRKLGLLKMARLDASSCAFVAPEKFDCLKPVIDKEG